MSSICQIHDFNVTGPHVMLRDCIICTIAGQSQDMPELIELSQLHNYINKENINAIRLSAFRAVNKLPWQDLLKTAVLPEVVNILGPDLCIQKKINLSIQMPNDSTSLLAAHTDCNSGDSAFQYNLWIPLTDSYSSNSMFILDEKRSGQYYNNLFKPDSNIKPMASPEDFVNIKFGQYLLFPPSLIHGNILNTTSDTRVSLNVRIKSVFSPYFKSTPPDRRFGTYYEQWNLSDSFRWNASVHSLLDL